MLNWPLVVVRQDPPRGVGDYWAASPSSGHCKFRRLQLHLSYSNSAAGAVAVPVCCSCGSSVSALAATRRFGTSCGFCVASSVLPFTPELHFHFFEFLIDYSCRVLMFNSVALVNPFNTFVHLAHYIAPGWAAISSLKTVRLFIHSVSMHETYFSGV